VKRFPPNPANPHRVCWGCDLYCAADQMRCGNGSVRTPHPAELFGDDWAEWEPGRADAGSESAGGDAAASPPRADAGG
jgi:hypothetical protein